MSLGGASLEAMVAQARAAGLAGRLEEAIGRWSEIAASHPSNVEAAINLARLSLRRGAAAEAAAHFARAEALNPKDPLIPLERAVAHRKLGEEEEEFDALERAIVLDPYCYPAMLFKGAWLERRARPREAARLYEIALKIAPANASPGLQPAIARAREVLDASRREFDAFLQQRLQTTRARFPDVALERFDECKDAAVGFKKIYTHQPTLLHFPRLPAIQYFDDAHFPWMAELEAATGDIAEELTRLVAEEAPGFVPYVRFRPGDPVNQWTELNHSPKWSAFFFYENGAPIEENMRRCPKTAAALANIPQAVTPGYSPNAFFSTLAPGAHIPPHTGSTNARLIGHLPLIVPGECLFRVGNETRQWKTGKAWVFDDSIEHEAWNRTDKLRVILIFDVWNPLLSEAEREMVNAFLTARREYYAAG
jgi:aspartyl/asparaginyl beta-hydroxylase (cupin superfamily)